MKKLLIPIVLGGTFFTGWKCCMFFIARGLEGMYRDGSLEISIIKEYKNEKESLKSKLRQWIVLTEEIGKGDPLISDMTFKEIATLIRERV